jgi:hypothetical protein
MKTGKNGNRIIEEEKKDKHNTKRMGIIGETTIQ